MAAAWRLTGRGHRVTLVERRPYLGGRAYSFLDRETGCQVDNGQHVYLGCCTEYIAFLRELGTLGRTHRQSSLRLEVRDGTGRRGVLSSSPLPAPLQILPSFLRFPFLGWREKLMVALAMLRIRRTPQHRRAGLERESFSDWLKHSGHSWLT